MDARYDVYFDGASEPEFSRETLEEAKADGYATVAGNDLVEYFSVAEVDLHAEAGDAAAREVFDSRTPA